MAEYEAENGASDEERQREEEKRQEFMAEVEAARAEVRERIKMLDEEIQAIRERQAVRRGEQDKWLEKIKENEEKRRKNQEEELQRIKEQQEKKEQEREERRRAMNNPNQFQPIIQDERIRFAKMTTAELQNEKEETLTKRVPALNFEEMTSEESLKAIAEDLHAKIVKAFGALFDLDEKEKRQKYDIKELNSRIEDIQDNKLKASHNSEGKIHKISNPF